MGRDKLNDSQQQNKRFPKIEVGLRLEIRGDDNGKSVFSYWKSKTKDEEGRRMILDKPLTGILIGAVMSVSHFDKDWGKKGGEWKSSYFLSKKNSIAVFDPSGDHAFSGDKDSLDKWAASKGFEKFKTKKRLIILTDAGLVVDVATNITLYIGQINQFDKDLFKDYLMTLIPDVYDVDTNPLEFNEKTIGWLGPFASKNKPRFARIEQGEPLTDKLWEDAGGDDVADMYIAWKKSISAGQKVDESVEEEVHEDHAPPPPDIEEAEDDLPF